MCDVPSTSGGGEGGGVGLKLAGAVAAAAVLYVAVHAKETPAAQPVAAVQAAPVRAGFPWLTASVSVVVGAVLVGLVLLAVRVMRRRRREAEQMRQAAARPVPQRAIEPPPVSAKAWLDGKVDAR